MRQKGKEDINILQKKKKMLFAVSNTIAEIIFHLFLPISIFQTCQTTFLTPKFVLPNPFQE